MTASWWIIVLSWNGRDDTLTCLDSLTRLASDDVAVACVDNGSDDGTVAAVRAAHPHVTVIQNRRNLGFSGGNNAGIAYALAHGAEWVVLVNNDATLAPDAIERLRASAARHPDAGALAGKLFFAPVGDGEPERIWFAGQDVRLWLGYAGRPAGYGKPDAPRHGVERQVDRAAGAFMAVSRPAIEAVGMLDDALFAYVEDVDWSVRIRGAGYGVWLVPDAVARHRVSASTGGERGSTHALYYGVRNSIVVCERHRPLPPPLRWLRRQAIRAIFMAQALLLSEGRSAFVRAVRDGYRDARVGRLGERSASSRS
ncbi:MAG TPA: glycosyltransferase family 2 protein [Conexibacter sp.]|nr:glycosyltransferase family 2 protein [Conexibacter sp.]